MGKTKLYTEESSLLTNLFSNFDKMYTDFVLNERDSSIMSTLLHKSKSGNYELRLNVAGYKKEDIEVYVEDGTILEVVQDNKEYGYRKFTSTIPENLTDPTAKLEDGILIITFKETKNKKKKNISIN
jgi:HSP20 family molecular chaperone IbpA